MSRAEIESLRSSLNTAIEKDNKTEIVTYLNAFLIIRLIVIMH